MPSRTTVLILSVRRQCRRCRLAALVAAWLGLAVCGASQGADMLTGSVVRIGKEAMLPDHPRSHFARRVNNAPVGGETVGLNPPRFRWRYHPDGDGGGLFEFIFQVARTRRFARPIVNVRTPFNFYNTLAPLGGRGPFYWRVGYVEGGEAGGDKPVRWSPARMFRIAPDAKVWDRSALARPDFAAKPHPRILLSEANRRGVTILMVTHDRELAKRRAGRVAHGRCAHYSRRSRSVSTRVAADPAALRRR